MKNLLILIAVSALAVNVSAQAVHFPSCDDLEVTNMQFDNTTGHDTLYVSVYNDCDTCDQMAYTGLIVVSEGDTLAMSRTRGNEQSPENNTSRTYALLTNNGKFDLHASSLKVAMYLVCDSIPISLDFVIGVNPDIKKNCEGGRQVILSGSYISTAYQNVFIKEIAIYNGAFGRLVDRETGLSTSSYAIQLSKPGMYLISLVLSNGKKASLKYIKTD